MWFLLDDVAPAEGIFHLAVLDAGEVVVKLLADLADLAVVYGEDVVAVLELANGRNNSGGAGAEGFLQAAGLGGFFQLVDGRRRSETL